MRPLPPDERRVDAALLRSLPLERIDGPATKKQRGTALVVGGSAETPGGAVLAGVAALRMGAGKLQIATVSSAAPSLAVAVPESRVIALRETADGAISPDATEQLAPAAAQADAVLVGTSTLDPAATGALLERLIPHLGSDTTLILDAGAIPILRDRPDLVADIAARAAVIPNPAEMATMLAVSEDDVRNDPGGVLCDAVRRLGCVVSLRDATTRTTGPELPHYVDGSGHRALGTSGSGDVLAGALLGLAARGADPLRATIWAVHVHGLAGERLGVHGPGIGTLARDLLAELPIAVQSIGGGA
jgi:ADP-dependent NAD(P)H-hydrate dehydratase